jgi:hypothetical protein
MEFLFDASEGLSYLGLALLFILVAELGFRLGRREHAQAKDHHRTHAGAIQASVLGLMALLLGFTFSLSSARFESHKQLMLEEVNAIGSAYQRAALLPQPYQGELSKLFQPYVQVRVRFLDAGDAQQVRDIAQRTQELQARMWAQAVAAATADPHSVAAGLVVQSLNAMFDVTTKRTAALRSRVPESVLRLLLFVGCVAFGLIGYGQGLGGMRVLKLIVALAALVAAVMILIVDLDRPRGGLIQVNQQSMTDLQQSLGGGG